MELKKQVIQSTKWNSLATIFNLGFQFVKLIVLTRLLDKADFGLVAIATMVISFTSIFSDLGFTIAIIHKQDTTEQQYSSLYWANVIFSVLLFIIVVATSPLVASFYNESRLTLIVSLLGVEILANAFGKMFQTIKMKSLDFKFISIVNIVCTIIGFVVTVALAILGYGVYSLVIGQLVQVVITQIVFMLSGRKSIKITLHFDIREIKDYILIGSYGLGSKVVDFAASKIDVFLIGRFFGMEALGVYNLAKELIAKPYTILGKIFYNIGVSAFAIIQNNVSAVKEKLSMVVNAVSLLTIPLYVVLAIFADRVVPIIYSSSYVEIVPLVRIFAIYGIISSIELVSASIRDAKGKTDYSLLWTFLLLIITTAITVVLKNTSINYLACAISIISIITIWPFWYITIYKTAGVTFKDYIKSFSNNFLISTLVGLIIFGLFLINNTTPVVIILSVLYCLLYLVGEYLFNRHAVNQLWYIIYKKRKE